MPPRTLWAEVIDRRKTWHAQDGRDSMEDWTAADPAWPQRLDDVVTVAIQATLGENEVDPRAALVDVLAVASSWIDRMG